MLDVVVIGAGPAGLHAALLLAEEGFDVAVLEEHDGIGTPTHCTGIVSDEISDLFKVPESIILSRPRRCELVAPSGFTVSFDSDRERVAVIDRGQFDLELALGARRAGAEIRTGFRVDRIATGADEVVVTGTRGQHLRARACVLACGVSYGLQRQLGLPLPALLLASAQVEVDAPRAASALELHVGGETAPEGFAWVVPISREGRPRVKVGLMARGNATDHLRRFLCHRAVPEGLAAEPGSYGRRLLPLGPAGKTFGHRVVTVGDAAGLTKPTTGGGIFYALLSASMAADTLAGALRRNTLGEDGLCVYESRWRARLDSHLRISSYARRLFARLTDAELEPLVRAIGADDVRDVIRHTARFNWHGRTIRAVLRQRGVTSILMQALLR